MATVAELNVRLTAETSGLQAGLRQADQGVSQMTRALQNAASAMAGLGLAAIGKQIASIGIQFLALKEQAQIAFTTLLGSGELAASFLRELEAFAARTPFEFPDLLRAAQRLTAMGFAARDVIPMLTAIGDAAAAMGASSATIDRITLALGQMAAKGKVSHEEMRQLAEVGIPVWQILADKIGKTIPEAMKLAEKGMLDGKKAVKDLIDGIQNGTQNVQAFAGMMEKQSKTVQGLASTLKDLGRQAIGDILAPAFEKLRGVMAKAVEILPQVVNWFQQLDADIKNGVLAFGALLTVGPLVVGALGLIGTALGALLSPIGAVVAALGVLGVAYASNLGGIRDAVNEFAGVVAGIWSNHGNELNRITSETWALISEQIRDNFHRISEIIKVGSAVMQGDWERAGKGLIETTLSFTVSMGDIIFNFTSRLLPRWLNNALISVRNFAVNVARTLAGIEGPKLDFKAPSTVPGLPSWEVIAQSDRMLQGLNKTLSSTGGHAKAAKKEMSELEKAMRDVSQAIEDGLLGGDKIGRQLSEKYQQFIQPLLDKAAKLAETVRAIGDSLTRDLGKSIDTITPKIVAGDASFEMLINRLIAMKKASEETAKAMDKEFEALSDLFKDLSASLPNSWNIIIDGIITGTKKAGADLLNFGIKVKGYANDILRVFDTMPGKWGDAFRRTIDEVNRWVSFIDSAIRLIQRILGSDQTGLGGIFSNLIKAFKNTTDAIASTSTSIQDQMSGIANVMQYASQQSQDAFNAIGTSATNAANTIGNTAGKFASAATSVIGSIMGIVGGLSLLLGGGSAFGGGTLGKSISGALGGAALGAGLASLANFILGAGVFALGPAGLIGAAIGGLVGLFKGIFGGKSEAQKRAEQQAAQQAEFNAQQSAQNVINAAIEGFDNALRFFDNLDAFTAPRKAKFQAFWVAMNRLMQGFLDLAKNWAGTSLAEAKAFAESVGPIVETVGNAVAAFDALSGYLGVPERAITKFSTDLQLVLEKFIAVMEAFPRERFIKHARTFADRIQSVVSVIGAGIQSFTALKDYQGIASSTFDLFAADLRLAVEKMIGIADSINAGMVKEAQRFSDRVGSVVTVIGTAVSSFIALKDYGKIPIAVFDAFFADLLAATNRMAAITTQIDQEMLGQAAQFADRITPISSALKLWAEAAEIIRGYTAIAAEVWDQILADFERGLVLINLLIVDAQLYVERAQTFRDLIAEGSADIVAALSQYVSSIQSMSSTLIGMPMGGTPVGTMVPTSQGAMGTSSQQSVSLTLNLNGNDPRTQQVIQFIESVFGAGTLSGTSSQFA